MRGVRMEMWKKQRVCGRRNIRLDVLHEPKRWLKPFCFSPARKQVLLLESLCQWMEELQRRKKLRDVSSSRSFLVPISSIQMVRVLVCSINDIQFVPLRSMLRSISPGKMGSARKWKWSQHFLSKVQTGGLPEIQE